MHVPNFLLKPSTEVSQIFGDAQEKDMARRLIRLIPEDFGACCCSAANVEHGVPVSLITLCWSHFGRSQSVYLQVLGITRLDKTITTVHNLWTLA